MSVAAEARAEGFAALLADDSETLTITRDDEDTEITALVNRDPFEKRRGDSPSFTPGDVSSIEFAIDALSPEIEVGEAFVDQFDHTHRVQSIKRMGNKVRCHCEVSDPE